MSRFISIPRQALAELLQAVGSPLTPEQYLASLPELGLYAKYRGRARAAAWSKSILLIVAILSALIVPFDFDFEGVIIVAGLATVTFFEFRVHRYFRDLNPAAPTLGFRNQSAFAAAILIYGLYHTVVTFHLSPETQTLIEENNVVDLDMVRNLTRVFYLVIGVVGGVSQFGLAWYYRAARVAEQA